jgi:hypothetical protein
VKEIKVSKYRLSVTSYEEGDCEYDASDYNYQIIAKDEDNDDYMPYLCATKEDADKLMSLLNAV